MLFTLADQGPFRVLTWGGPTTFTFVVDFVIHIPRISFLFYFLFYKLQLNSSICFFFFLEFQMESAAFAFHISRSMPNIPIVELGERHRFL